MKIYEAIAMLEQMDQTKECTVTFGQPKSLLGLPQLPLHQQYFQPLWVNQMPAVSDTTITCLNQATHTGPYN